MSGDLILCMAPRFGFTDSPIKQNQTVSRKVKK